MFSKQKDASGVEASPTSQTVISEGITIKDNMICGSGSVSIGGVFFGDIDIDGFLVISESGSIQGDIRAHGAHVHGAAEGNLVIQNSVRIFRGGRVFGDVHCGSFVVDEGAIFGGQCNMTSETAPLRPAQRPQELGILPIPAAVEQA